MKYFSLFFLCISQLIFSQQSQNIWTWIGGSKAPSADISDYALEGLEHPDNYPTPTEFIDGVMLDNDDFYFFGGGNVYGSENNLLWKFSNANQMWSYKSGDFLDDIKDKVFSGGAEDYRNTPGVRKGVQLWKDLDNNIWLFSGRYNNLYENQFYEYNKNDLWKYNTQTERWSKVKSETNQNLPNFGEIGVESVDVQPPLTYSAQTWTTADGYLWMFGGNVVGPDGYIKIMNTLWRFNPQTQMWACISGQRPNFDLGTYGVQGVESDLNYPPSRRGASTWVDEGGYLWFFGGGVASVYSENGTMTIENTNEIWKYNPQTNLWTWVKGNFTSTETFPVIGAENINNMPKGSGEPTSWLDENKELWYYYEGKMWKYNPLNNIWVLKKNLFSWETVVPEEVNVYNEFYSPNDGGTQNNFSSHNQSWVYNGEFYYLAGNIFWKYNPTLNSWAMINRIGIQNGTFKNKIVLEGNQTEFTHPGSHYNYGAKWNDSEGNLWFYYKYGKGYNNFVGDSPEIWKYDVSALRWEYIRGFRFDFGSSDLNYGQLGVEEYFNNPTGRQNPYSWIDQDNNLWYYGGTNLSNTYKSDLWKFNTLTKNWVWADGFSGTNEIPNYANQNEYSEENTPGGRRQGVTWKDNSGNFYLFGGFGFITSGNQGNLNDVWRYSISEGQWAWIKGKNNNDTPEFSAGLGIVDQNNQPVGGRDYSSWNDLEGNLWIITSNGGLWKFDDENWIQMTENSNLQYGLIGSYHENNSPGVRHNASTWVEENGSLLLFGGSEDFYNGPSEDYRYNDLWRFDINLNQWAWIGGEKHVGNSQDNRYGIYGALNEPFLTNLPGVRQKTMFWQDNERNYYLYGGNGLGEDAGGYLSDVWKLNRTFNVISGEIQIDVNNDGCQNTNLKMPYTRIDVGNNPEPYTIFSNSNGAYVEVNELNDFSLVPQAPYYSFEPVSADFSFPTVGNSLSQNFCAVGNGNVNDLNIAIIPLTDPAPGNINKYKIIYKNVGTTTLSGNIQVNFQDNYMNFTSAVPNINSQAENLISWNYENLQPYESREIEFNMEFNTPTHPEFPLNSDDELIFEAVINPLDIDETPDDNSFSLTQIVVNSFDPNDKICLQGESILVDEVGDYVYYKIRFENTGTANASHIVITDFIDPEKFEISSLLPVDSSHDFSLSVNENILRVNFEYISLPYPPSQLRFGYIVFKIRTKSSLEEGDIFANTANIYFDYNYPIITNDYQTIIEEEMSTSEYTINDVNLYPNPTKGILNVNSKLPTSRIEIFDLSGRLISVLNNRSNQIDISSLSAGIYLIKVHSGKSISDFKIIKK